MKQMILDSMERDLAEAGVQAPLQIMQSRGGIASSRIARCRPVCLFLSGPAAGVIGGLEVGQALGLDDLITIDVGRHQLRYRAREWRAAADQIRGRNRRLFRARAHGGRERNRRWRRQHRVARWRRGPAGRTGIRGLRARSRLGACNSPEAAESTPGSRGTRMRSMPSSRASAVACSGPAPPSGTTRRHR